MGDGVVNDCSGCPIFMGGMGWLTIVLDVQSLFF